MQTLNIFPYYAINLKITLIINVKTVKPKTFFFEELALLPVRESYFFNAVMTKHLGLCPNMDGY